MKLFPNFTNILFDYLLISWVTNYVSILGFLTCLSWIVSIENSTLERLELKFGVSSEFFDKIPVRILLDVLFHVFRFSKVSFYVLESSFMTFKTSSPSWHWDLRKVVMAICNFTCKTTNYSWNFAPKLRSNSSPMILGRLLMQWLYISGTIILLNIYLLGAACLWEVSQVRSVHVAKQNIEFTSSYPLADPVIS